MIRKFLFIFLSTLSASASVLQAQCISDTTLKSPGYKPDPLPNAKEGEAYNQSLSVLTPRDTTVYFGTTPVNVTVDSIRATGVYGMPPGISYTCQDPRCVFVWDEVRCIGLSGTCNNPGVYPLTIPVIAYAKWGTTPLSRPDTIRRFSIVVDPVAGIYVSGKQDQSDLRFFPNPATGITRLWHPELRSGEPLYLRDALGRICAVYAAGTGGLTQISLSGLNPGMYIVSAAGKTGRLLITEP